MADGARSGPLNDPQRDPRRVPATIAPGAVAAREPYGPIGGYGGVPIRDDSGGLRHMVLDYLRIFMKRKWMILAVTLVILAVGAVRTLMMTPMYSTSVRIQIERDSVKVVEGGNINQNNETGYDDFMRTQYELLQSRSMAQRVASQLKLGEDSELFMPRGGSLLDVIRGFFGGPRKPPPAASQTDVSIRQKQAAGIVAGGLQIRPVPGSRLVDIQITDTSPDRAQLIANAYADAFIASIVDKRFEANSFAKTFLEDQIKQLKIRLEDSERALLDFASQAQVVEVSEKTSIAETNLSTVNSALTTLISERIKAEQLWLQLERSDGINMPQILTNSVIDGLRARRNLLVADYQEKLETYKPGYPLMVQIDQKIKEIDRQLASEVRTIKASLKASFDSLSNQEKEMRARIENLKIEVLELQKKMISHNILKREVDTNRGLYNGLLQRFKEIDVASGVVTNNVFVVDRALRPGAPSSPNLSRALVLALGLGLGVGLGLALLLDQLDDRLHTLEEMERVVALPTLGIIPKIDEKEAIEDEIKDARSVVSEAYRSLATALQFSTDRGLPRTMLVTSSGPGEGKSITSIAIARHFAMMGLKVLLIDSDLRNPSLHKKLKTDNTVGLSNYLTGSHSPQETFQETDLQTLAFMSSGPLPPNAADLLSGKRLHSLLSVGLEVFDIIIVDGPPVIGLADAQLLANATEGTIFVVAAGQSRVGLVRGSLQRLQLARAVIIGAVLTKLDTRSAAYGYGYSYTYGGDGAAKKPLKSSPDPFEFAGLPERPR